MNDVITQSSTGLVIPEDVSEEQFFDYGIKLAHADKTLQWYIGDWYNAIPWGDKKAACEKAGLNYKTAKNCGTICQMYQMSRRSDISFKHHQVIAALPEPERLPLLQQAAENHWSTTVLKKQAFPEQQPPKPKKEEDMPFNWINIACEEGVMSPSANGDTRSAVKEHLLGIDPDCFTAKNADRFRDACRALKAQSQQKDAREEAERAKAELPKSAQEKLDRALKKWQVVYVAELRQQFAEQLKAEKDKVQAVLDAASILHAEAQAERDAAVEYRLGVDSHMTMEEFQLVRNCLHPDRVPEDRKERFTKAFGIFDRLQKTVNTKKPIEALRRNGWEKVSPYYKPH